MSTFGKFIKKHQQDFKKLPAYNKAVILLLLLLCFTFGLYLPKIFPSIFKLNFMQNFNISAKKELAYLALTSDKKSVKKNDAFKVTLTLDSRNNNVEAADFVLTYDSNVLEAVNVTTGKFFPNYPKKESGDGKVTISGSATVSGDKLIIPKGKDTVAVISFKAISTKTSAKISFDKEKTIVASGGKSILNTDKITDLKINIK